MIVAFKMANIFELFIDYLNSASNIQLKNIYMILYPLTLVYCFCVA